MDENCLNDVTGIDTNKVDRLPAFTTSLVDGYTQILGVPKLTSGSPIFSLMSSVFHEIHTPVIDFIRNVQGSQFRG